MVGTTISHYKVLSEVGRGGMGVVYKAEDTKLERPVALKFLAPHAVEDPEHKARFVREAKAAARLDHPNICPVYEIDEADGQIFIAMAFLEGQTVKAKIAERPLKLAEALDIAVQTAQGLKAAHRKEIVHRDIKPANLMLNEEGQIKIMDFGLAQLAEGSKLTKTSTLLGTAAYMSPEQAQRLPTDHRTDVWSLGVVIYQMVTGRLPFEGEREQAVLYAIASEEPEPPTALRSGVPLELDRIVSKAMAKSPEERYQHIDEVLVDLRALRERLEPHAPKMPAAGRAAPARGRPARLWPIALLAAALGAFVAGWLFRPAPETQAPSTLGRPTPLTTYPGREVFPSFSPEGDRVVFAWEGESRDNWDIYVRLIGEDTLQRLTYDAAIDSGPAWSPDGRRIAFMRNDPDSSRVMLVPSIGGSAREVVKGPRVAQGSAGGGFWSSRLVGWHPDGEHLVISWREEKGAPPQLYLLTVDTGEIQKLLSADWVEHGDVDPAVSPDGRRLAFRRQSGNYVFSVYLADLTESLEIAGEPRNLTGELVAVSPAWTPNGEEIIFAAGSSSQRARLWRVSVEGGDPRPISLPSEGAYPALSPAGGRAAFALPSHDFDIWQAQLPGVEAEKPLISSTYLDVTPKYSPDGAKIAFSSSRSGYREIWICNSDGSTPVQLTHLESRQSAMPYWSPDGSRIVFHSFVGNQHEIFVVSATGGKPQNLTDHPALDRQPSWSRDGRWIYFGSDRSGEQRIWKIPAEGGEAVPVTKRGEYALESLDGQTLYFSAHGSLWSIPAVGGSRKLLVEGGVKADNFAVARDGIYLELRRSSAQRGLDFYDFSSKTVGRLFNFSLRSYPGLSVHPDGETILFVQGELPESDIMLLDEFR